MKIIQLIPGAGNTFYCENCLRDNALLKVLQEKNHEVLKVPLYLPVLAEDADGQSESPVFFGGINVYLQQKSGFFRNSPAWVDRLLDAPLLLRWISNLSGMTRASDLAETTLSMLEGENGRQVKELDRLISWLRTVEKPDIIHLSNCLLSGMAKRIREELNVPVVTTLQDEDIFIDPLPEPYRSRVWETLSGNARNLDGFIAVSHFFRKMMRDRLHIPEERITTIYNGIPLNGYEQSANGFDPPVIGFLERQCSEKGLHLLIDAFIQLKETNSIQDLKLRIAGGKIAADDGYIRKIRRRLSSKGLLRDVEFLPCLKRQDRQDFLKSLSVLSVPAIHREAFGIYVLEALAAGVPVVQPSHGAFPELLEITGGGLLCEPNDPADLAETLKALLLNPDYARSLGAKGRKKVLKQFGIHQMADAYIQFMEKVIAAFAFKGIKH